MRRFALRRWLRWLRRLWPRTVRGRVTLAVTAVTGVALMVCVSVLLVAVHRELASTNRMAAERQMTELDYLLRNFKVDTPISKIQVTTTSTVDGVTRVEEGHGLDQSQALFGAITKVHEGATGPVKVNVRTEGGTYRIQAEPDLGAATSAAETIRWLVVPGVPLILILVAGLTWFAMGRALRPVEAIRGEFAEITSQDLHRRVPDPESGDEVSRLARTMNETLNQLERAVLGLRSFAADASHELRSPLTTLRTRLELAVARPEQADWADIGPESLQDAEQLQGIVEDLLLLARLDAGQIQRPQNVDVVALIRQMDIRQIDLQPIDADRPDRVRLDLRSDAPVLVRGSRVALSRLLANLVDNATRHARPPVRVRCSTGAGQVVIEVTDAGPGIPEADRLTVFDRFTRLDQARTREESLGGTGLGLAIARDIAIAHGGGLTAEEPDPGTTGARLVLTLPTV